MAKKKRDDTAEDLKNFIQRISDSPYQLKLDNSDPLIEELLTLNSYVREAAFNHYPRYYTSYVKEAILAEMVVSEAENVICEEHHLFIIHASLMLLLEPMLNRNGVYHA